MKSCKADVFNHVLYSIVCNHRNAQQHSSGNNSQPADVEYETPNQPGRNNRPHYDVMQLGQTRHGPRAGHHH